MLEDRFSDPRSHRAPNGPEGPPFFVRRSEIDMGDVWGAYFCI